MKWTSTKSIPPYKIYTILENEYIFFFWKNLFLNSMAAIKKNEKLWILLTQTDSVEQDIRQLLIRLQQPQQMEILYIVFDGSSAHRQRKRQRMWWVSSREREKTKYEMKINSIYSPWVQMSA